ncbi:MetQ/NlpA family ABC transporter substrate-binding protein [Alteribacter natronophilus]|uniref:MetQ/NlpA family ABC transporter substrate-binding protein n=1 Tax=Alteribacter natronophilus TaxID=2583810 RepID=UPI00110DCDB3|nr:MetQ/NlpA family ABC transporter substrate-binding protein [Alteribacter natronophilus]TMW71263.1 MetQ/NlpA family ABC transporter substrate-binding protein [Alteribacter natronophilus]
MKKSLLTTIGAAGLLALTACGDSDASGEELSEDQLRIGVTAGPHEQILEKVQEVAADKGLDIEIEVFTEYVMPNIALDEGELDANSFQHTPYLENFRNERNLDIVSVADTVNFPMGIYSEELSDVSELQEGDSVGLPNDPTNGARALMLFEEAGLITLEEDAGTEATVNDIADNPLDLNFVELEASQLPRQLNELSAATINTNFAVEHGYVPTEDSIFIEPEDSPWFNVIAVREENKDDAVIETLIEAYHSEEVKQFIEEEFQGSVVTSW